MYNQKVTKKTHILKIKKEYFLAIFNNSKKFELRKDDRCFNVGDYIHFNVLIDNELMDTNNNFIITYILRDCPEYGLMDGYCILGIEEIQNV